MKNVSGYQKKILEKEQRNQQELEAAIVNLEEEIEILKEALERSLEFLSVEEYNSLYKKDWTEEECKKAEKEMTIYCLTDCIRIKERESEKNRAASGRWMRIFCRKFKNKSRNG